MVTPGGIGALLREIREKAGRTRSEQAQLITDAGRWCDPENLKLWETERRVPTPVWHGVLVSAYGLRAEQIQQAVAASRRYRKQQREESEDVERRKFFGATAAALSVVAFPDIAQARDHIDSALGHAGHADAAYFEAVFERHRGGYAGRAPDDVLAVMHQDLEDLSAALSRPMPAGDRTDLVRAAAGITGLVAIIQHDRGDQRDAVRWFTTAEKAARECGDRSMLAWVLARHAMVPLNYQAPHAAARLAATARREAGASPTAAAALAAAVSARSLAAIGDTDGAARAIRDTRNLADRLDGIQAADTWFGYPGQKHHVHLSQAYTLLGDTTAAYAAQEDALALTTSPSVMTRALLAMDTAICLRTDGDPTAAAQMAAGILERLPASYRGGLVTSRAQTLHQRLDGRARALLGDALA